MNMKEELIKVGKYLIREWLVQSVLFCVIAAAFHNMSLIGWGILGGIFGKAWRDRYDN